MGGKGRVGEGDPAEERLSKGEEAGFLEQKENLREWETVLHLLLV